MHCFQDALLLVFLDFYLHFLSNLSRQACTQILKKFTVIMAKVMQLISLFIIVCIVLKTLKRALTTFYRPENSVFP